MITEDVNPNDRLVEFRVGALNDVVIKVLLVPQSIHPFKDKFEKSVQVLGAWTRYKYI